MPGQWHNQPTPTSLGQGCLRSFPYIYEIKPSSGVAGSEGAPPTDIGSDKNVAALECLETFFSLTRVPPAWPRR